LDLLFPSGVDCFGLTDSGGVEEGVRTLRVELNQRMSGSDPNPYSKQRSYMTRSSSATHPCDVAVGVEFGPIAVPCRSSCNSTMSIEIRVL